MLKLGNRKLTNATNNGLFLLEPTVVVVYVRLVRVKRRGRGGVFIVSWMSQSAGPWAGVVVIIVTNRGGKRSLPRIEGGRLHYLRALSFAVVAKDCCCF